MAVSASAPGSWWSCKAGKPGQRTVPRGKTLCFRRCDCRRSRRDRRRNRHRVRADCAPWRPIRRARPARGRLGITAVSEFYPVTLDCLACTLSDNPPLPLLELHFPGVVPGHGGCVDLGPGHHHGIALSRRASQALSQVSETAASVFAFEQNAPSSNQHHQVIKRRSFKLDRRRLVPPLNRGSSGRDPVSLECRSRDKQGNDLTRKSSGESVEVGRDVGQQSQFKFWGIQWRE